MLENFQCEAVRVGSLVAPQKFLTGASGLPGASCSIVIMRIPGPPKVGKIMAQNL